MTKKNLPSSIPVVQNIASSKLTPASDDSPSPASASSYFLVTHVQQPSLPEQTSSTTRTRAPTRSPVPVPALTSTPTVALHDPTSAGGGGGGGGYGYHGHGSPTTNSSAFRPPPQNQPHYNVNNNAWRYHCPLFMNPHQRAFCRTVAGPSIQLHPCLLRSLFPSNSNTPPLSKVPSPPY